MASETVCDICSNKVEICDNGFTMDIILELLDVVFTNGEPRNTSDPNICKICLEKVHETFIFKSKCINIEDILTPYKEKYNFDLNLKDIVKNEKMLVDVENLNVDIFCRLCFTPISKEKTKLHNAIRMYELENVFKKNLSELTLELVKEPCVCESCILSLQKYRNLVNIYEQAQTSIKESSEEGFKIKSAHKKSRSNVRCRNSTSKKSNKVTCPDCSMRLLKTSLPRHQKRVHKIANKKFSCEKCHYFGVDATALKSHQLVHKTDGECEWFRCKLCSYKSKQNNKLRRHMLMHQDIPPKYKCEICDYRTHYKENLKKHMVKHDDNAEVFKCDQCDYQTRHKGYLKYHKVIHEQPDKVKQYKCTICSYQTIHLGNLIKQHMLTHQPNEKKFYQCDKCDFKTSYKAHYRNHDKVHKDFDEVDCYKCDSCPFITKHKTSIVLHVANHLKNAVEPSV